MSHNGQESMNVLLLLELVIHSSLARYVVHTACVEVLRHLSLLWSYFSTFDCLRRSPQTFLLVKLNFILKVTSIISVPQRENIHF